MSKIVFRSLIIGVLIVLIGFIGGGPEYIVSLFAPPRVYIVIGVIVIFILLKILFELKNKE